MVAGSRRTGCDKKGVIKYVSNRMFRFPVLCLTCILYIASWCFCEAGLEVVYFYIMCVEPYNIGTAMGLG